MLTDSKNTSNNDNDNNNNNNNNSNVAWRGPGSAP